MRAALRSIILILMLGFSAEHAPWKLMVLYTEAMTIQNGITRVPMTNGHKWEAEDLKARLEFLGWDVEWTDDLGGMCGCYGLTNPRTRHIDIDSALSWDARFSVLAHEAGHTLQMQRLTENQGEVFAEAVSTLVSHDGFRDHARYLAAMRGDLWILFAYAGEIYQVAGLVQPGF